MAHHKRDYYLTPHDRSLLLSPKLLFRSMLFDPIQKLNCATLKRSYTMDVTKYHDFFVVTVSRTFYYMGISVQTFFLYFIHDVIHIRKDPEAAVAMLAIVGQCAGALTCYPVGLISDRLWGGRRKPFVYLSCAILSSATLLLILCSDMAHITILGIILGGANGMYLTMDTSLAVDTLPKDDDEDGTGSAQLLGIWGVAGFIGSALGPLIGGPLLYLFGHQDPSSYATNDDGTDGEEYSLKGYVVVMALSSFYFCLSALSLRHIKDRHI